MVTGDLQEVSWRELFLRRGNEHVLAEIGEERQFLHPFVCQQPVEGEVAPLQQAAVDRRPLRKDDVCRLLAHRLER